MAQVTIGAGSSAVTLYTRVGSLSVSAPLGQAATSSFDIVDPNGQYHFYKGQPVKIVSARDTSQVFFYGFVDARKEVKYGYSPGRMHSISCVDNTYLAQKRVVGAAYTNMLAGDIVSELANNILSQEGVRGMHAIQANSTTTDFATGTLVNVAAYSDGSDGHLEIAHGGSTVSRTEQSQSDWGSGTLTGDVTNATAGHLTLAPHNVIKVTATSTTTSASWYLPIGGTVSQTIATGDTLQYDVFVPSSSVVIRGGVDCASNNGTHANFRDFHVLDQNGFDSHPGTDLTAYADGVWYSRTISLTNLAGNTVTQWSVGMDSITAVGSLLVYFKNIYVKNSSGAVKYTVFDDTVSSETFGTATNTNVTGTSGSETTGYDSGVRISPALDLTNAAIVQSSSISWTTAAVPTGTSLTIQTSINSGKTWQPATSGQAIGNVLVGQNLAGFSLLVKQTLSIGGDPTNGTPDLTSLTVSVQAAPAAVKTDWLKDESTTTSFAGGTLTNVLAVNNSLSLNSYINTTWMTGTTDNQTQWTSGTSPSTTVKNGTCILGVTGSGDVKSQLGNITSEAAFYASVSFTVPSNSTGSAGFIYRTTAWSTQKDGYAYYVGVNSTTLTFGHGTNSTSSSAFTSLQSVTISLTAGSTVRLDVEVTGSSHTFFVNGTQYGPYTDSTYTAAGGFALRFNNTSASASTTTFSKLGVVYSASLSGTRVSQGISLPPIQAGASYIDWVVSTPSGTSVTFDISYNNGTTWITGLTAETALPTITAGTSLVGMTICWRMNLSTTNPAVTPVVSGFSAKIASAYYAGGIREHPPLDFSSVGIAGSAPVVYDTMLPANTAIRVDSTLALPDTATSTAGWSSSGTFVIDETLGENDSSSYALGANSYAFQQLKLTDTHCYDFDVYIDSGSASRALNFYFNCSAAGAGQAFHFNVGSNQSGFTTTTTWTSAANVTGAGVYYEVTASATWYHITLVLQSGTASAYINGQFAGSMTYANTGSFLGFSTPTTTSGSYTAHFDNLRLWNIQPGTAQNIPGINYADGSFVDSFDDDTSGLYLSTSESSSSGGSTGLPNTLPMVLPSAGTGGGTSSTGTPATWTWDIDNSRLVASGGVDAILLYSTPLNSTNVTLVADIAMADAGGFIARESDTSDFYELLISDNSGTNAEQSFTLSVLVGGAKVLLGQSGKVSWTRGDLHRVTWAVEGASHTVSFGGDVVLTVTNSSLLQIGYAGLYNTTVDSGSSFEVYNLSITPTGSDTTGVVATVREHLTTSDPTGVPELLDITLSCRSWYIQDGPTILSSVFSYPTVADALTQLATQSNYFWMIDQDKQLWFMPRTAVLAPWIADGTNMILETIEIDHGNPLYRNQQYIRGVVETTDPQVEQQKGDGAKQSFTVGYPINQVPTIKVNGVAQTVGIKGTDTGEQWYWSQGQNTITQDQAGTPLASTDIIEIDYIGQFEAVIISNDQTLILDRQTVEGGGSGLVEAVEDEPNDTSADIAQQSASQLIATYGVIGVTIKFTTKKSGLQVGQLLTVNLPDMDIEYQDYLIEQADPTEGPGGVTYWNISAIEGPVTGNWLAAFARMSAKTPVVVDQLNVGTNEVLTTALPIGESWPWTESVTPLVNNGSAPSTTLYPSTSIYPL